MANILKEIQNPSCMACSCGWDATNVCQMRSETKLEEGMLMVVGDYPSDWEGQQGTVMQSGKWKLFWQVLLDCITGTDRKYVYPTYAVKCRAQDGHKPEEEDMAKCWEYLEQEIQAVKPRCILVLGNIAQAAFKLEGQLNKMRGNAHSLTIGKGETKFKTSVIATYDPFFVSNTENILPLFAKDIQRAYHMARGVVNRPSLTKVKELHTIEEIEQVISYCERIGECCCDFETTEMSELGVEADDFRATMLSVSFQHGSAYTIPLWHHESPFSDAECLAILSMFSERLWQNPDIRKINQNIKFDMHVTAHYGFPVFRGRIDDTMLMHHVLWENRKHGLKDYIIDYYPEYEGYEDEVKKHGYSKAPLSVLTPYAGTDTDLTMRACTIFENLLLEDPRLYNLYRNAIMFSNKVLFRAELRGMFIDKETLTRNRNRAKELLKIQKELLMSFKEVKRFEKYTREEKVQQQIDKLTARKKELTEERKVLVQAGRKTGVKDKSITNIDEKIKELKLGTATAKYEGFNLSSPAQIGGLLYGKHGFGFRMPYVKKYRKQHPSTENVYLKMLGDTSGFIHELMVYRTIDKNLTTYLEAFEKLMDSKGRIHTSFLIHGTRTGRLASKNPNLQNITKHVKLKSEAVEEVVGMIMQNFAAPEGHVIMQMDFSQAELRIVAELANETNMIEAYNNDVDIHAVTASKIMGITLQELLDLPKKDKDAARQKGKAANFGLIYLQSAKGFRDYAQDKYGVNMTLEEAERIIDTFFETYPNLPRYHKEYIRKGMVYGHVRTLFGRTRKLPDIRSNDSYLQAEDERVAVNSPVQGSCGEMTIFALSLLEYRLPRSVQFVNTVHDSIVFYVPYKHVDYAAGVIKHTAENLPTKMFFGKELTKLKLKADVEISTTHWKAMKTYTKETWKEMQKEIFA